MTNKVNSRELVLEILMNVTRDGEYSHIALANVLDKYQYLDKKERAFITRVTEGTLEQMLRIDYILDRFSSVPVRKMKPQIRGILRSGVYQICFMDAVPDSAACNEAVRLAQKKGFVRLKGFVNGVLRNVSRGKESIVYPDKETQPVSWLSVMYSIPEWMIRMWQEENGWDFSNAEHFAAMEKLLRAFLTPALVTVRANGSMCTPKKLQEQLLAEGVTVQQIPGLSGAFAISGYDYLGALPSFSQGMFYVQDVSAMRVAQTAQPKDGDFVVDVCAAPGGKSVHVAQLLHGTGRVLARDLTDYKVALIEDNIARCHVSNMEAQVWDARKPDASLQAQADIVIADLPCSGLGVMRKKKDIRYKMTPEKLAGLVKLQREILSVVHRYVKPGGRLVYSTCTIHRAENEDMAQWFADNHDEFTLVSSTQLLPGETYGDGFYIALFERRS